RNEVEALLTEANLIKNHKPKYNIDLRDDKSYPFIKITKEPYPQVLITRKIEKDGSKYYGPFTDVNRLRIIMNLLTKIFPIRSCTYQINESVIKEKKISLCLDYHIHKCEGPCEGLVSEKHYAEMVSRIESFIKGRTQKTVDYLRNLMMKASKEEKYEIAGIYRDQLNVIKIFQEKQKLISSNFDDRDIIALAKNNPIGIAVVLRIRNGRILSREKIVINNLDNSDKKNIATIITRFYLDSVLIPREILLQTKPLNDKDLITWLTEKAERKVKFVYPKIGDKAKEVRITYQNAKLLLGEWILKRQKKRDIVPKTIEKLRSDLNLAVPPKRIEAFDVSHLGGKDIVGSMVCFVNTKPKKSEYRKFKIKSVDDNNDFASIQEIVFRRYNRAIKESSPLPNLILIDGGKGQLSAAGLSLKKLGLEHIPIIGLAKRLEEVYVPGLKDPQSIEKQSPGLILLRKIRDEAHRFAITFQKSKRDANLVLSPFERIKGMGKKRVNTLLCTFENIKTISQLTAEVLNGETGIPLKISDEIILMAKSIYKNQSN
ncbi:excinuclease ABC subunit UvrC, partial [Candidatus Marinimicrobia bacterium]|nr:excinuclease ABC subunit UvrC [Candidatus Neomarinimicrobiota bacterium]